VSPSNSAPTLMVWIPFSSFERSTFLSLYLYCPGVSVVWLWLHEYAEGLVVFEINP